MQPNIRSRPCPICAGHRDMPPGQGTRCWGFVDDGGEYVHCSREEHAGSLQRNEKSNAYAHRLNGPCKCGVTHREEMARVTPIGQAAHTIDKTYDYVDAAGALLFQVVRYRPKTFRQRRPNGRGGWEYNLQGVDLVPYRLPEVVAAVAAGDAVFIAEGEKDVDALREAGCAATCNPMGAGKWREQFSALLAGAAVVIVRDKDDAGTKHAREVFASLRNVAASVRVVEARSGKDAADHLAAGHTVDQFVPVWPVGDLRKSDPIAWKRRALRMSLDATDPLREIKANESLERPAEPTWPTGLGDTWGHLPNFRGVAIVVGVPSSGKSVLALGSGIDAARDGWDVVYLSCEMAELPFAKRVRARCGDYVPATFHLVDVGFGASIDKLLAWIEEQISANPTLVIFDSVSSFCDQAEQQENTDPHGTVLLKKLVMWAINVRRATDGQISFMLLAEASKEGRARGRFADHKADIALLMESTDNPLVKTLTVTKAWEYTTGAVGDFAIRPDTAALEKV